MDPTDFELINRIRERDEKALSILHRRYVSDLVRFAHFALGVEKNLAFGYANEALFRATTSLNNFNFKPNCKLRSWLITILRNIVIDEYRKETVKMDGVTEVSIDAGGPDGMEGTGQRETNDMQITEYLSTGMKEDKRKSVILDAFSIFSKEDKELLFAYFNDISHDEMSRWRGSNTIATRQHLHRLKKKYFQEIEKLTGIKAKVINERWQSSNSKRSHAGSTER